MTAPGHTPGPWLTSHREAHDKALSTQAAIIMIADASKLLDFTALCGVLLGLVRDRQDVELEILRPLCDALTHLSDTIAKAEGAVLPNEETESGDQND